MTRRDGDETDDDRPQSMTNHDITHDTPGAEEEPRAAGTFPFTAIVDQTEMKRALVLNAINPDVGGVLIRGERGTAKSTAVRALAEVLPDIEAVADCPYGCPPDDHDRMCDDCRERHAAGDDLPTETRSMRVVDLPLNASEDRVVGSIDLERAVQAGERQFEPGILADANRNILYVDEVNLLDDHIVDVLLDAAAMGENIVEREGVSFRHPSEFILVGTMNPEEGDLRPQLLDRFGLVVDVEGVTEVDDRVEISRRRAAFEANPEAFRAEYADEQAALREDIAAARTRLDGVALGDDVARLIAGMNIELDVDGHRGDITLRRAARTLAAFEGDDEVTARTVRRVARMALEHRLQRLPFEEEEQDVMGVFHDVRRELGLED
ncbi:ATP-binding protein [Halolamina sp. CBA1230]|uniref:ATP-binding protein n=1 Tax=Halolamina sp. CBA1230 TaxID=1853690 RepID=UPI0020D134CC|nr:AAA family ATPase [Halolamina sp. CBA1230]